MTNVHYLRNQMSMAADCIRRALDALENEPDDNGPADAELLQVCTRPPAGWTCSRMADHDGPCAASPSPIAEVAQALGLVEVRADEKLWIAITDRVTKLTWILLELAPELCAKHALLPEKP